MMGARVMLSSCFSSVKSCQIHREFTLYWVYIECTELAYFRRIPRKALDVPHSQPQRKCCLLRVVRWPKKGNDGGLCICWWSVLFDHYSVPNKRISSSLPYPESLRQAPVRLESSRYVPSLCFKTCRQESSFAYLIPNRFLDYFSLKWHSIEIMRQRANIMYKCFDFSFFLFISAVLQFNMPV